MVLRKKPHGQGHYSPSVIAKTSSCDPGLPARQQPPLAASRYREMAFQYAVQGIQKYSIPRKKSRKNVPPVRSSRDLPVASLISHLNRSKTYSPFNRVILTDLTIARYTVNFNGCCRAAGPGFLNRSSGHSGHQHPERDPPRQSRPPPALCCRCPPPSLLKDGRSMRSSHIILNWLPF